MKIIKVITGPVPSGDYYRQPETILGYSWWIQVDRPGACDLLRVDDGVDPRVRPIAHCHPAIPATEMLAQELEVPVGSYVAGVRWWSEDDGTPCANDDVKRCPNCGVTR